MNLDAFHEWLMHTLPARPDQIIDDLGKLHKALPKSYEGLPRGGPQITQALKDLEVRGLVRQELGEWRWCDKPAKVEPQRMMF